MAIFFADKDRIERVIVNLISNAVKFTKDGHISFSIKYNDVSKSIKISVKDTGLGISEEDERKLFKLWGKLDREDSNKRGIGLGLTISNMLVCAMNEINVEERAIKVKSEVAKGSSFSFSFPIVMCLEVKNKSPLLISKRQSAITQWKSIEEVSTMRQLKKILFLEDEETNIYVMKTLLDRKGIPYTHCYNGREAIIKVVEAYDDDSFYPIILSDINMPVMDGFLFAKWLRSFEFEKQKFSTMLVACSANVSIKDTELFLSSGFNERIGKPIDISKIDELIDRYF